LVSVVSHQSVYLRRLPLPLYRFSQLQTVCVSLGLSVCLSVCAL